MNLLEQDKNFLKLLLRSPDRGNEWRTVSEPLWELVTSFTYKDLLEVDEQGKRVRFSERGKVLVDYLL